MPEENEQEEKKREQDGAILVDWKEFLETHPPSLELVVSNAIAWGRPRNYGQDVHTIARPDLLLYCNSDSCQGPRTFEHRGEIPSAYNLRTILAFLHYRCRNCHATEKRFSVIVQRQGDLEAVPGTTHSLAYKFGELPPFGPHVPARVLRLVQSDVEIFNKGRRAENLGLGVGAYAYYRRVVENQKDHLIGEIIKVSKRLNAPPDVIQRLERAKTQFQFTQAVEDFKDAIPPALLINGHNPLVLLHNALSKGLHDGTDEECLELAHAIRVVLTELSDRLSQALKDEAELKSAVARLVSKKSS